MRPVIRLLMSTVMGLAAHAHAQAQVQPLPWPPVPQNVVNLNAQASTEVPQDMVAITLQALREGSDAATVQGQLRQALEAALGEARKAVRPGLLEVRTGAFALSPRYAVKPGAAPTVTGWQGRAELVLEGRDIGAIGQLAGRLGGLTVSQVQPGLSREARDRAEAEVSALAIQQFKARAESHARQFGFANYSLREVTVSGGDSAPPASPPMFRLARSAAAPAEEAQPLAPGQITVTATVSGSIQLSPR